MRKSASSKSFSDGDLSIQVNSTPYKLKLVWTGRSVARDPGVMLAPFFNDLEELLGSDCDVEIDFRRFEYMNSSTLKPIIRFVQFASERSRTVQVVYDAQKSWQRLSFKLLSAVAGSLDNVRVDH